MMVTMAMDNGSGDHGVDDDGGGGDDDADEGGDDGNYSNNNGGGDHGIRDFKTQRRAGKENVA